MAAYGNFRRVIGGANLSTESHLAVARRSVVFFDGACGVCDRLVVFALKRDRRRLLAFAPLQGSTARALLPPSVIAGELLSTVLVLTDGGTLLSRSRAIRHLLRQFAGGWQVAAMVMGLVPVSLADAAYAWFARHRHRLLGPPACRLVSPEDRERLLD